jgi:hypothetical protein
MPEQDDGGQRYAVHASGAIARTLRQIQRQAEREGRGDKLVAAIRQIYQQLRRAPNAVGEPLYRLPSLRMQVRAAAVAPLGINFGVCEDRPLVFIKGVRLLSEQKS